MIMVAGAQTTGDISRLLVGESCSKLVFKLDSLLTVQNSEVIGIFNIDAFMLFL